MIMEPFNSLAVMKKLMKSLMLFAAAAMALTSCDNEGINEGIENNDTYTLTFVADAPQSRTSVDISGGIADFSWSANDKVGFVQYAVGVDKTNRTGSKETTIEGNVATFTTEFEAQTGASAYNYAAYYPYTTPANDATKTFDNIVLNFPARQAYTVDTFDPKADLLMSKTIEDKDLNAHGGYLVFARLVAVAKMAYTLEGAEDGEVVKNVKFSIENAVLSGQVTLDFENTTAEYATEGNNYVEVNGEDVGSEIFFTCFPGEYTGNYTIEVETDKANYTKNGTFNKAFNLSAGNVLTFSATVGGREAKPAELTEDTLNRAFTGISGTTYTTWTDKTATSGAVYAGNSAGGNEAIQLRSNNDNSGIVTTTSGGYVKNIEVTWNSNTAEGRTLNVYGKNSAYSAATDLYSAGTQGTLLGTIVCGTSTELAINYDFQYIGFRSNSGAMYLDEVKITWSEEASGNVPTQLATPSNVKATVDGKDVTLTWDAVENADSYSITVGDKPYTTTSLTKTITMDAYGTEYEFSIVATSDVIDYSTSEAAVIIATTGEEPETPGTGEGTGNTDTIVFADLGYSDASALGEIVVGNTTLNFTQGSASTPAKYYNNGSAARLYQDSTMTVTGTENISKIDFEFVSSSYNTLSTTTGTYSDTSWTGSASSITFTVGSSGQTRIVSMTITYGGGSSEGGEGGETPEPEDPETPDTVTKTLSCLFADNDATGWGTSYAAHTFTYDVAKINFGTASKQTGTITTMPVTKNGTVDVVMTNGAKLTAVTYNCAQWGTKNQTMKLYYSTDGSSFTEYTTNVTWSNFVLTCTSLPEGTVAVRAKGTSSSYQIGIESVVITYTN